MDRLGVMGINVIGRVFGIVIAALSVQYILDWLGRCAGQFTGTSTRVETIYRRQTAFS